METYLHIDNLVIETTRRCNMSCAHCLRGPAENMDMDMEKLRDFFSRVKRVNTLTLSGGEPSLNVAGLRALLDLCEELDVTVYNFYIVTNGKEVAPDFLHVILDWDMFTVSNGGGDANTLALSSDIFHEEIPYENKSLLERLTIFNDEDKRNGSYKRGLLNEGRAEELSSSTYNKQELFDEALNVEHTFDDEDVLLIEGTVYVSADGKILNTCDCSYAHQAMYQIGHTDDMQGFIRSLEEKVAHNESALQELLRMLESKESA